MCLVEPDLQGLSGRRAIEMCHGALYRRKRGAAVSIPDMSDMQSGACKSQIHSDAQKVRGAAKRSARVRSAANCNAHAGRTVIPLDIRLRRRRLIAFAANRGEMSPPRARRRERDVEERDDASQDLVGHAHRRGQGNEEGGCLSFDAGHRTSQEVAELVHLERVVGQPLRQLEVPGWLPLCPSGEPPRAHQDGGRRADRVSCSSRSALTYRASSLAGQMTSSVAPRRAQRLRAPAHPALVSRPTRRRPPRSLDSGACARRGR